MTRSDVGIFNVFVIEGAEFPIGVLGALSIVEVGDMAENSHLFDQGLQSVHVDSKQRIVSGHLNALLLVLSQLFDPDTDDLLQPTAGKVTE